MTNSQYQAYLKALSQLRKRNINKVKAAYQELIADDGKRSIQNLQCCNDQLIAMKSELQHMRKSCFLRLRKSSQQHVSIGSFLKERFRSSEYLLLLRNSVTCTS